VLNEFAGQTILVFAATCNGKQRKSNSNPHTSEITASQATMFSFLS
jgi:hypothetical protein